MRLNGSRFRLFVTDTYNTILNRIAARYDSLPKYLKFTPKIKTIHDFTGDIQVEDVLGEIKGRREYALPPELYDRLSKDYPHLEPISDIDEIFVVYNKNLTDPSEIGPRHIVAAIQTRYKPAHDIWEYKDRVISNHEEALDKISRQVGSTRDIMMAIDNATPTPHTPFQPEKIKFSIDLGNTEYTIQELFNRMVTTYTVPMAILNNIFKVKREVVPKEGWIPGLSEEAFVPQPDSILLKVNSNLKVDGYESTYESTYNDVAVAILEKKIFMTLSLNLGRRYVTEAEFIDRVLEVFPYDKFAIYSNTKLSIIGIYTYPRQTFDAVVWADLVMNDKTFNTLFAVDEFFQPSKIRPNVYLHSLFSSDTVGMQMNEDGGVSYIRVRLKVDTEKKQVGIQDMISRLLTIYTDKFDEVADAYKDLDPTYEPIYPIPYVEPQVGKKTDLKDIAPDIFPIKYTRHCTKPPSIVSEDEVGDRPSMVFPIKDESIPHIFICDHEKEIYPGLKENKLPNKDKYPFIPCCYVKDQKTIPGSNYNYYYIGEELREKTIPKQEVFLTGKILHKGSVGVLPKHITRLLDTTVDPTYTFMRRGISRTKASSLEAILTAKGVINGHEDTIARILRRERRRITTPEYAASAKQELYNHTIEEITSMLQTHDLRPTMFIRPLEIEYNFNLYIFTEKGLVVPDHIMGYYRYKPDQTRDSIILYQHWGSESDAADYPQCELIIQYERGTGGQRYFYRSNEPVVKLLDTMVSQLTQKYDLQRGIYVPPIQHRPIPVVSQYIDTYGKARMINTHYQDEPLTLMTEPLPPFNRGISSDFYRGELDLIKRMIETYRFQVQSQTVDPGTQHTREVHILLGSIRATFLTDDPDQLDGVDITYDVTYKFMDVSQPQKIHMFMVNEKLSRIIIQYTLYKVSEFLGEKGAERMTKKLFKEFTRQYVSIDPSIKYDLKAIRPVFSCGNGTGGILKEDKLVLPSMEVWKRLIFYVNLYQLRHKSDFNRYSTFFNIPDFYKDISDYKKYKEEYILDGIEAINHLIVEGKAGPLRIVNHIKVGAVEPYPFQNNLLGSTVYLATNVSTYTTAVEVIDTWKTKGYLAAPSGYLPASKVLTDPKPQVREIWEEDEPEITTPPIPTLDIAPITMYKYINEHNIQVIMDHGSTSSILAYKVEGVPGYTILLSL